MAPHDRSSAFPRAGTARWLSALAVPALVGPLAGPPGCGAATREVRVEQPIEFNHQAHVGFLTAGEHRAEMIQMHLEALELDPEDAPEEMWTCTMCHARDEKPQCFGCHELYWKPSLRARTDVRACVGCHRGAWSGGMASIPTVAVCEACHAGEPRTGGEGAAPHAQEVRLRGYLERGQDVPWVQINTAPDHVYFSHSAHVQYGGMDCATCHGDMSLASRPPTHAVALAMDDCLRCHEQRGADTDCIACHR